eukprot:TRINITY_DN243_c0_g1_i1.p1 TRINITY_DN243_c0_g1~~TRINITY_DN243_c0_g1_i1.p1  ORF type:complete len:189 (-),score=36.10 TRINITY_DN243_c0_g1_i1:191-757(-)
MGNPSSKNLKKSNEKGNQADYPSYEDDPGITVVVSAASNSNSTEEELKTLRSLPISEPIIEKSGDINWVWNSKIVLPVMDPRAMFSICGQYQTFLRQKQKDICGNQSKLAHKITQAESRITNVSRKVTLHCNDIRNFEFHFQDVDKMERNIENMNQSLLYILESIDRLCQILPPEDSLEPIHSLLEKD